MGAIAGPETGVRPAESADELEAAAEALALAFADDPCWAHLLPEDETRAEKLLAYFTSEIETLVPEYREVWVTEDGGGAAIWAPPGRWRVPIGLTLREAGRMTRRLRPPPAARPARPGPPRRPPPEVPRALVPALPRGGTAPPGPRPRRRADARRCSSVCDRERIPAYLESSTDRNRMLYERNGFALTGVFDMPGRGGPPIREMWRDAAGAG